MGSVIRKVPGSGITAPGSGITSQGNGIRQFHFCGIREQNVSCFWNQGSEDWLKKMGQPMENLPGYDPVTRCDDWRHYSILL